MMTLSTPSPEHRQQHQRDQDRGEGELQVDDAHHDVLDAAADIGRREPTDAPMVQRDDGRRHADEEEMRRP